MSRLKDYLTESNKPKILNELFIEVDNIANIKNNKERDKQIARISMISELDAVNLYEKLSLLATNKDLKEILLDIAKEEKVHNGEFEYILSKIDPDWEGLEDDGEEEAENKTK